MGTRPDQDYNQRQRRGPIQSGSKSTKKGTGGNAKDKPIRSGGRVLDQFIGGAPKGRGSATQRDAATYGNPSDSFGGAQQPGAHKTASKGGPYSGTRSPKPLRMPTGLSGDLAGERAAQRRSLHPIGGGSPSSGPSGMSLSDLLGVLLGQANENLPSTPHVSPTLIDVNAALAPFDQARSGVDAQAQRRREQLLTLAAEGTKDVQGQEQYDASRLRELAAQQSRQRDRDQQTLSSGFGETRGDLQTAGVDPQMLAQLKAAQQAQSNTLGSLQDAGATQTESQRQSLELENQRRRADQSAGDRAASSGLEDNVSNAIMQIAMQRAQAQTDVTQQNSQAQAAADQANQEADAARREQLMGMGPALIQQLSQYDDPFVAPKADAVQRWMDNYDRRQGQNGYADDVLGQLFDSYDNEDDAIKNLQSGLDAATTQAGRKPTENPINFNTEFLKKMIRDHYKRTTGTVRPEVADELQQMMMLMMGITPQGGGGGGVGPRGF